MTFTNAKKKRIKAKLDRAARILTEVHQMARETLPDAYVFAEGSGYLCVMENYNNRNPLVCSERHKFDAGAF